MWKSHVLCLFVLSLFAVEVNRLEAQDEWARFRGPNGMGKSDLQGAPSSWKESDYEWVVDLPGKGHSSPCVWKNKLFLTAGQKDGTRMLLCLDANTGKQLWSRTTPLKPNHLHKKNSYGSGTPTTDGERVYIAESDGEQYVVLAYTMDGEKVWTHDLGTFESAHGLGVSPILYHGLLIIPNDQVGPSSIEALDAKTGKTVWQTSRKKEIASYATPMIVNVNGEDQIVVLSGASGLAGLNPKNGKQLWESGDLPQRTVASPVFGNGVLIASCGSGGRGKYMLAVDPKNAGNSKLIVAERKQNLPYVPTPVILGQYLYLWNDDGIVCCIDMQGDLNKNVWRERVGGNYSGSPVIIDGKIYCISEDGDVKVIDASPTFHQYAGGKLGDPSYSTPAIANGRIYFRSFHRLASLKVKSNVVGLNEK